MSSLKSPSALVFDLGGVLVDWNPRHLFREHFGQDEAAMERFLAEVCTTEWNEEQDAGRPWSEGVRLLQAQHPKWSHLIKHYDTDWEKTLRGTLADSVEILRELKVARVPLYALSNWSAEKFPHALERFEFLSWFDGMVISGQVRLKKPDPRIFRHLLNRFGLDAAQTLFIDDSPKNVDAALQLGFQAHLFRSAPELRRELVNLNLLHF